MLIAKFRVDPIFCFEIIATVTFSQFTWKCLFLPFWGGFGWFDPRISNIY